MMTMRKILLLMMSFVMLATANASQVKLAWDANTEAILSGYKVYYGPASRSYTASIDAGLTATPATPTFTVINLPDGTTVYFAVTAYSGDRTESGYSNEVFICASCSTSPPIAGFTATPVTGVAPLLVKFTDTSTPTSGNQILNWAWTFGDGKTSNIQSPSNTYSAAGSYSISLTVTDQGNRTGTVTKRNYITVTTTQPPIANFTANPLSGRTPLRVTFTNISTGTVTKWAWKFGDGYTSASKTPAPHTYYTVGTYSASLTATGASGATSTKTQTISVRTR